MLAIVKTGKGKGNIELQDVSEPMPGEDEVKIEVKAAGICGSDIHLWDDDIKIPKAVDSGLDLVRKGGKYTQIGLFGRRVEADFEKIAYKEIVLRGSFSHRWSSWELALKLLSQGKVNTKPLISNILPISKWEEGFNMHRAKKGMKILLTPESASAT